MRRRMLAAVAALVLLVVGAAVLVTYVQAADERALAGVRTVEVLVADTVIPEGTPAEDLPAFVRTEQVPARSAVGGRVDDLSILTGTVAAVDLQPGEQLLAARFVRPEDQEQPGTVEVPAGLQEVSILLDPARAVGGRLTAGDRVGVLISRGGETHAVLHFVLVTRVQGAPAPTPVQGGTETASAASDPLPAGSLMLTFAVSAAQAEAVVWGVEHGTVWLSLEPEGADISGTEVVTPLTIYGKAF